jgi:hypothetical protein
MAIQDSKIIMIARCRRDVKLCFRALLEVKIYNDKKFSPEDVRKEAKINWQKASFFYGGPGREICYKTIAGVLWQHGNKKNQLQLIVLAPMPYVRGGKRNYREPAYLLATDLNIEVKILMQSYLVRWQIEYNHQDKKSILGVG